MKENNIYGVKKQFMTRDQFTAKGSEIFKDLPIKKSPSEL